MRSEILYIVPIIIVLCYIVRYWHLIAFVIFNKYPKYKHRLMKLAEKDINEKEFIRIMKHLGMDSAVFESEKECVDVIQDFLSNVKVGDSITDYAKKQGYIKQSSLEVAKALDYIELGNMEYCETRDKYIKELEKKG